MRCVLCVGSLFSLSLLLPLLQGCEETEQLITEMPAVEEPPSECVLTCTALTYRRILRSRQKLTARFKDSRPGTSGEFCWILPERCGTVWDEAVVLLSLSDLDGAVDQIWLQTDSALQSEPLEPQESPSVLPNDCGLRFDVTPLLRATHSHTFCVQPLGVVGNILRCPPVLVTIRHTHRNNAQS